MHVLNNLSTKKQLLYLLFFSIAMGFMEAAVVIYLRRIYYPEGFDFPMQFIDANIAIVEILREAATLIMLVTIGILSGRSRIERFGYFLFCFAIWDISYYLFLYVFLDWPDSLLTWDVLFLIPTTWTGPVLGPLINATTMVVLALIILRNTQVHLKANFTVPEWILLISGSLIIIASYMEDYLRFMLSEFSIREILLMANAEQQIQRAASYIPVSYSWWKFILGEVFFLFAMVTYYRRNKKPRM